MKHLFWGNRELRHPSDETIVAYLDGELGQRKARTLESHLAACWACRRRREKFEAAIGDFVDYMDETCPAAPRAWRSFERGLAGRETPVEDRAGLWWRALRPARALQYAAALLCAGVVWFWLSPGPVSAKEFLVRGIRAESLKAGQAAGRVVYQKLRVRRSRPRAAASTAMIELWRDPAAPQARQTTGDESWRELERILAFNGMDPQQPLSPAGFSRWRDRLVARDERVVEADLPGGGQGLALQTGVPGPHAQDAIVQARLLVRTADWHPVSESLHVQGADEVVQYELTEVAFELRPPDAPLLAANLPPAPPPAPHAGPLEPPPALAPTIDAGAVEVEARYALHRLRACLGEPVEVVREASGRVTVKGLAETPERKQELTAALRRVPGLKIDIRMPDEFPSAPPSPRASAAAPAASAPPQKAVLPIQAVLAEHFRRTAGPEDAASRIAALSTDAVSMASTVLADAWSLRRLADAYPPERVAALDAAHHRLLEDMYRDHAVALHQAAGQGVTLLEPVLAEIAGPSAGAAGLIRPADPCNILEAAQAADRLTRGLLAGADDMRESPDQAARLLLASLRAVEAQTAVLEAALRGGAAARECHCQDLARK